MHCIAPTEWLTASAPNCLATSAYAFLRASLAVAAAVALTKVMRQKGPCLASAGHAGSEHTTSVYDPRLAGCGCVWAGRLHLACVSFCAKHPA